MAQASRDQGSHLDHHWDIIEHLSILGDLAISSQSFKQQRHARNLIKGFLTLLSWTEILKSYLWLAATMQKACRFALWLSHSSVLPTPFSLNAEQKCRSTVKKFKNLCFWPCQGFSGWEPWKSRNSSKKGNILMHWHFSLKSNFLENKMLVWLNGHLMTIVPRRVLAVVQQWSLCSAFGVQWEQGKSKL